VTASRSKYSSEEERRAAQADMRRRRRALVNELLKQHRMMSAARDLEARVMERYEAPTLKNNEGLLKDPAIRKTMIHTLVTKYNAEVKLQMDAYRLLQKGEE
jgi:hypothetical protein